MLEIGEIGVNSSRPLSDPFNDFLSLSARPTSHASTRLTPSAVSHTRSVDQDGAIDQPPSCSSVALQTHRDTPPQQVTSLWEFIYLTFL